MTRKDICTCSVQMLLFKRYFYLQLVSCGSHRYRGPSTPAEGICLQDQDVVALSCCQKLWDLMVLSVHCSAHSLGHDGCALLMVCPLKAHVLEACPQCGDVKSRWSL
jgi:hypothetical protein